MIEITTSSGFKTSVEENALDNMELLEALGELQEGKAVASAKVAELILGKEGKKELYSQIKAKHNGRVPIEVFSDTLKEIFETAGKSVKK